MLAFCQPEEKLLFVSREAEDHCGLCCGHSSAQENEYVMRMMIMTKLHFRKSGKCVATGYIAFNRYRKSSS